MNDITLCSKFIEKSVKVNDFIRSLFFVFC